MGERVPKTNMYMGNSGPNLASVLGKKWEHEIDPRRLRPSKEQSQQKEKGKG